MNIRDICEFLTTGQFVLGYVAALLMFAFSTFAFNLIPRTRRISKRLTWLSGELGAQKNHREFKTNFELLNASFSNDELIGHVWSEFAETLILPGLEEAGVDHVRNTEEPERYFNRESLVQPKVNLRILAAIPNPHNSRNLKREKPPRGKKALQHVPSTTQEAFA